MTKSTPLVTQPFLPIEGIVNARELGGYAVQDGRHVRNGMLIRSAHLATAKEADLRYLESLPTVKIIDFRMEMEKKGRVDKDVPGAKYVSIHLDASVSAGAKVTDKHRNRFVGKKWFNVTKVIVPVSFHKAAKSIAQAIYPTLVFHPECQKQMVVFFREVLNTPDGAILFHCTQGKDRTGIAAALLLAALGADRETIIKDFDTSNLIYEKELRKYIRRVKFWGGKEEEIAVVKSFVGANTDNFIKVLDDIDSQYGSLEAYLKGPMELTDNDINILRERYLV